MAMALGDGGQIARETACVYSITKIAQLSSAPPNWRTYLVRSWEQPSRPADAVLPRTEQEVQYWNKYVAEGWGEGERQANEIFLNDLGRLQRDHHRHGFVTGCSCAPASSRTRVSRPKTAGGRRAAAANSGLETGSSPSPPNQACRRTQASGVARAACPK